MLATPIALTQLGEPGGSLLLAPCVLAPQIRNDGEEPPEQQTSASLLFQSHADTLLDLHRRNNHATTLEFNGTHDWIINILRHWSVFPACAALCMNVWLRAPMIVQY